jgi:uncharacterized peroxidase-related enzyme
MTWIMTISEKDAVGDLKSAYDRVRTSRGRVANIFKSQSLNPRSLLAHLDLYLSLMFGGGGLSRQEREMIAVVVSAENRCRYCVRHHSAALAKYVKDEGLIAGLAENPRGALLGPRERAMVDYAIALTKDPHSVTQENIAALRRQGMNDEEILQLATIAAYFNFVNRLADGLGVELEDEGQAGYNY